MSADNSCYIVSALHNRPVQYGIFRVRLSDDPVPAWYVSENAMQVYDNPVGAIVKAHRIDSLEPAEYGVHVHGLVISASERWFQSLIRPTKKNYGPA